jgi:hypothetical protein
MIYLSKWREKMRYETISLGPVPYDEDCQQVGSKNYSESLAQFEVRTFIRQLEGLFKVVPGAYFRVTKNDHDFGMYYDATIKYDGCDDEAIEFAYNVENNLPATWDAASLKDLENFKKEMESK